MPVPRIRTAWPRSQTPCRRTRLQGGWARSPGRWSCTACSCFGLNLADQQRTCFSYAYSACQAEYSRNLLFAYGGHMDRVFNAMLDRTRSRLDICVLRTLFGARRRPGKYGTAPRPGPGSCPGTPAWDLAVFKACFGLLTLKGCTKGARVLRFEAITHNTRQLGCGRALDRFPQIAARLAGMCASGSAPRWTASISASSPAARWISGRCPRNWAPAGSAAST